MQQFRFKAKSGKPFFKSVIDNASQESTIYIYDHITNDDFMVEYYGGVSTNKIIEELNAISTPVINLRFNSPGGDVFAARTVEAAIKEHNSKIIAHIDGLAASAASTLAIACDEVVISPGGMFMIHKASTGVYGNADDFESMTAALKAIDSTIADSYAAKTGKPVDELLAAMAKETWYTAKESIEIGFADRLEGDPNQAVENVIEWEFTGVKNQKNTVVEPEKVIENPVIFNDFKETRARELEILTAC